ncbi:MAG: hypothetical protein ACE5IJ_03890 [Thermoplasmata archaeon]
MRRKLALLTTLLVALIPAEAWGSAEITVTGVELLGEQMRVDEMSLLSITVENTGNETVTDLQLVVWPPHSWEPLVDPEQPTHQLQPGNEATLEFLLIPRFPGNQTAEFGILYTDEEGERTESLRLTATYPILPATETSGSPDPTPYLTAAFLAAIATLALLLYRAKARRRN